MKNDELLAELRAVHRKVDLLLSLVESRGGARLAPTRRSSARRKSTPLTEEEGQRYRSRLDELFARWLGGRDSEVQEELDALDVEELRRIADANNLNVTAKMPKQRVLQLIGARFREKRQLHVGLYRKGSDRA